MPVIKRRAGGAFAPLGTGRCPSPPASLTLIWGVCLLTAALMGHGEKQSLSYAGGTGKLAPP